MCPLREPGGDIAVRIGLTSIGVGIGERIVRALLGPSSPPLCVVEGERHRTVLRNESAMARSIVHAAATTWHAGPGPGPPCLPEGERGGEVPPVETLRVSTESLYLSLDTLRI